MKVYIVRLSDDTVYEIYSSEPMARAVSQTLNQSFQNKSWVQEWEVVRP